MNKYKEYLKIKHVSIIKSRYRLLVKLWHCGSFEQIVLKSLSPLEIYPYEVNLGGMWFRISWKIHVQHDEGRRLMNHFKKAAINLDKLLNKIAISALWKWTEYLQLRSAYSWQPVQERTCEPVGFLCCHILDLRGQWFNQGDGRSWDQGLLPLPERTHLTWRTVEWWAQVVSKQGSLRL